MFCSDPSRPRQILPVRGLLLQEALVEAVNTHHALHLSRSQSLRLHLCGRASRLLKLNSRATAPVSPILFTFRACHELSHVQQWTERASGRFRWCFFKVSKHVRTHLKQTILKQQRPDDAPKPSKPTTETRAATKSHQPHLHSLGFGCVSLDLSHLDVVSGISGSHQQGDPEGRALTGTGAPGCKRACGNLLPGVIIFLEKGLQLCSRNGEHVSHLHGGHPFDVCVQINSREKLRKCRCHHGWWWWWWWWCWCRGWSCSRSTSGPTTFFMAAQCDTKSCQAKKADVLAAVAACRPCAGLHQPPGPNPTLVCAWARQMQKVRLYL